VARGRCPSLQGYGGRGLVGAVCEADEIGYDDGEKEGVGKVDNNCDAWFEREQSQYSLNDKVDYGSEGYFEQGGIDTEISTRQDGRDYQHDEG